MKILKVSLGGVGGSAIVASQLANNLKDSGNDVTFLSLQKPFRLDTNIKYSTPDDPVYPVIENNEAKLAEFSILLLNRIKSLDPELIHTHYAYPFITLAPLLKRAFPKIPIILTLHGTDVTHFLRHSCYSKLFETCLKDVDHLTFVSNFLADKFRERYRHDNISIIPNFVDVVRENISKKEGLIHISNMRPAKRFEDVVKLHSVINNKVNVNLHIIGNSGQHISGRNIIKHGIVEDIFPILQERKIFISTSESEGFGLAALEAMSCGIPVVSSNSGGISELVKHNETGFLHKVGDIVSMAESATALLENQELYQTFSQNCLKLVKLRFLSGQIVPQYIDLYRKLS